MSSTVKRVAKKMEKNSLIFPADMCNNIFGSLAVCAYIFADDKTSLSIVDITKIWKKISKDPNRYIDFWLDDEKFIEKTLNLFKMPMPSKWSIAMVQSNLNILFAPYDDKTHTVFPLRSDGFMGPTLTTGKIYPVDFTSIADKEVKRND